MKSTTVEAEPCIPEKQQPYEPTLVGKYVCSCFDCRNAFLITKEELIYKGYTKCPDCKEITKANPAWTFTGAIDVYVYSRLYKKWIGQCSVCNKIYVISEPKEIRNLSDYLALNTDEVYERCFDKACGGDIKYVRCHSEEGKALLAKIGQSLLPKGI